MEQYLEDHMRLPTPIDLASTNANTGTGNGSGSISGSGSDNSNSNSNSTFIVDPTLHKSHRQMLHPSQQSQSQPQSQPQPHSHSASFLSQPYTTNANATSFFTASNHQQHPPSSALSPRPLAQAPAYSPPSYAYAQQSHDPSTLIFPDPPSTELAPLQLNPHSDITFNSLPSLASLTGPSTSSSLRFGHSSTTSDTSHSPPLRPRAWPVGNPYSAYYSSSHADSPARMDIDSMSSGTRGPLSPDPMGGRASSVSLDDPDVRMAAEALGDLKADFVSSPQNKNTPMPTSPPKNTFGTPGPPEPEPLLSLVVTSGSLLAKPIEGTVSAYNTTKNFSPGFIKTPVDYIEGVVGSGLHLSGIEGGVRWFFRGKGRHQSSSDLEVGENSHKRRKVDSWGKSTSAPRREATGVSPFTSPKSLDAQGHMDPYTFTNKDRRLSMSTVDTLPAYDDARSPAYTENVMGGQDEKSGNATPTNSRPSSSTPTAWQSRLIMSTSGLSIAMSEESLRSLKYCLSWLRWANDHIGRVIDALKDALGKYENQHPDQQDAVNAPEAQQTGDKARQQLRARIFALRSDVLKTLQGVIETVSKYAGGALPDNARALVRRHLTSLPQRFRLATQESNNTQASSSSSEEGKEKEIRDGAQRVIVLAKEGLDMMAQVSGVLDGTIVSAEEWCERLGRKRRQERQQVQGQGQGPTQQRQQQQQAQAQAQTVPFGGVGIDGDVKMG